MARLVAKMLPQQPSGRNSSGNSKQRQQQPQDVGSGAGLNATDPLSLTDFLRATGNGLRGLAFPFSFLFLAGNPMKARHPLVL